MAHVDDHETVRLGLAAIVAGEPDLDLAYSVSNIDALLAHAESVDLVLLDLRLGDGSSVESNVTRLLAHGCRVLAFTVGEDHMALRAASRAGVLGIVRKSESREAILDAIRSAARGEGVVTTEWAAALDGDPQLSAAKLSPKEREVLALYAAGQKSVTVADRAGLSTSTVAEYVKRIRAKYAKAGRPAATKIDLYRPAVDDGIITERG